MKDVFPSIGDISLSDYLGFDYTSPYRGSKYLMVQKLNMSDEVISGNSLSGSVGKEIQLSLERKGMHGYDTSLISPVGWSSPATGAGNDAALQNVIAHSWLCHDVIVSCDYKNRTISVVS